jgi:hypothetical protein
MKRLWVVVILLFVLWLLSMHFYMPLPVVILLFAALVSTASMTVWLAVMERRARRA